jgi:hypothetical protein
MVEAALHRPKRAKLARAYVPCLTTLRGSLPLCRLIDNGLFRIRQFYVG